MLIGIDGSEANEIEKVGSGQYAYELIWELYRINSTRKKKVDFIIFLKQGKINHLPKEKDWWRYEKLPSTSFWILKKLVPRLCKTPKPDVFFSPNHYLPIFTPIPQVCTIHDLGYLMFSDQFRLKDFWQLRCWTAISIIISKYIISVSGSVKNEIVRRYPFTRKKITIIHHGYDSNKYNTNISKYLVRRVKRKFKIRKNYILFLGTVKPSKNIVNIIEAFRILVSKNSQFEEYQLVITGKKGWMFRDVESLIQNDQRRKTIYTGFVSEEEKAALLYGAKALVSPSYWEGFGMHIIESMACGTPVVVSNIPALREIAGDACLYTETDKESISNAIEKVLTMNEMEYNNLVSKSLERVNLFSWKKTAMQTLSLLTNDL